ncbi:multiple C2 and transmembrane domain-containing protein 2-like isoform X1 [Pongo pygmaeus]|uniref:multiple C2 and transmembrane domain-containing protein 2-like isoform X1 n=1 Tax=Pongo pygmaeus TaxID=9600 RepID=UPI00300C81D9
MGPAFVILSDLELNRTTEHILKLEDPNSLEDDMGVIILNLNLVVKQGDFKRHSSLICNLRLSESLKRNQLWNGIISITLLEGKTVSGGSMTEIFVQLKLGDQRMGILDIEVWREDSKKQEESLGRCKVDISTPPLKQANCLELLLDSCLGTAKESRLPSHRCGPCTMTSFQRSVVWRRRKKGNFTVEKVDDTSSPRGSRLISTGGSHPDSMYP